MRRNNYFKAAFAFAAIALAASCAKDETAAGSTEPTVASGESLYIVVANPNSDTADVILRTTDLATDLTVVGSGTMSGQISSQWYFYNDSKMYGFKYADGDDVSVETYVLDGSIKSDGNHVGNRFTTYGTWGDYVLTSSSNSYANYYKYNSKEEKVYEYITDANNGTEVYPRYVQISKFKAASGRVDNVEMMADNWLGTGEYVNFAGFAVSDGKLYASVYPMGATAFGTAKFKTNFEETSTDYYTNSSKYLDFVSSGYGGTNSGSFKPGEIPTTPFPNKAYIAVFDDINNFPTNPLKIIETSDISPACGRKSSAQYPTIMTDSEENIYVFSPGNERSYTTGYQLYSSSTKTDDEEIDHVVLDADGKRTENVVGTGELFRAQGEKAASVKLIQKGETDFDSAYGTFDLETAMDGRSFLCCWNIKGTDKVLVQAYNNTGAMNGNPYTFYVVDPVAKTAEIVTGLPANDVISDVSRNPFFEDGYAYVGIASSDSSYPGIYKISAETAQGERISTVVCNSIRSIGKLVSE